MLSWRLAFLSANKWLCIQASGFYPFTAPSNNWFPSLCTIYSLLWLSSPEVAGTLLLKASNGWEKWWLGMGAVACYTLAGFFLAYVLKSMSVGLAYTIWSGVGIALVCVASILIWQQKFDTYATIGILLIVFGTVLITLKSNVLLQ